MMFTNIRVNLRELRLNDQREKYATNGKLQFTLPDVLTVFPIAQPTERRPPASAGLMKEIDAGNRETRWLTPEIDHRHV